MWPAVNIDYGSFQWLQREVARKLGYSPSVHLLDFDEESNVNSVIESGVRQFYYPPPTQLTLADPTEAQKERLRRGPYAWTFLQNVTSVNLVSGTSLYTLPADFLSFIEEPTVVGGKGLAIAEGSNIQQFLDNTPEIGTPRYCAVRKLAQASGQKPRLELLVYPVPDANITIKVRHSIEPLPLNETNNWPLSSTDHAETILSCCFAIIEERIGGDGSARVRMQERLVTSMSLDQLSATPAETGIFPLVDVDSPAATHGYLYKMVGHYLGYGPSPAVWNDQQLNHVREAVRIGLSRFYNPEILPGESISHRWSFLTPTRTVSTVSGNEVVALPVDVVAVYGLSFVDASHVAYRKIKLCSESQVRNYGQQYEVTGQPYLAAVRTSSTFSP